MRKVNEGTAATLTVKFKDQAGDPLVPTAISYTIWCETTGTSVLGSTAVTAAASVSIVLTGANNAIINAANASETKLVTLSVTLPGSLPQKGEYRYRVMNLLKV